MSTDDKDRYPPLWPTRNNVPVPKIAGWMSFGVIGGGAFLVLLTWLYYLAMERLVPDIASRPNLLWTFFLGAIICGSWIGGVMAWNWWRSAP